MADSRSCVCSIVRGRVKRTKGLTARSRFSSSSIGKTAAVAAHLCCCKLLCSTARCERELNRRAGPLRMDEPTKMDRPGGATQIRRGGGGIRGYTKYGA